MDVGITTEIDLNAEHKSYLIRDLSDNLSSFFSNRSYGSDIENIIVGCICIKIIPGYENWYKARRPKYQKESIVQLLDGRTSVTRNLFSYDFKFNNDEYESFINSEESKSKFLLAKKLIESLSNLKYLSKKSIDFDSELFIKDLLSLLNSGGYIVDLSN